MDTYSDDVLINTFHLIFDLEVSKKDLQLMKPDFVKKIYSLFLGDFGFDIKRIGVIPMQAPDAMHQFPEMYQATYFTLTLSKVIRKCLSMMSDDDSFAPKDLFNPDPQKTRRYFAMFIDFYLHLNEILPLCNQIEEEVGGEKLEKQNFIRNIAKLKDEKQRRLMLQAEEEKYFAESLKSLDAAKTDLKAAQEEKNFLKSTLEETKNRISELASVKKNSELKVLEGKKEIEDLSSLIFTDEEKADVDESEQVIQSYQTSLIELKENEATLKSNLKDLKTAEGILQSILHLLKEIESENAKAELASGSLKEISSQINSCQEKLEILDIESSACGETISDLQEKRDQLARTKEMKFKMYSEEASQLKLVLEQLHQRNEETDIVDQELSSELNSVLLETKRVKKNLEDFQKSLQSGFAFMQKEVQCHIELDQAKFQTLLED